MTDTAEYVVADLDGNKEVITTNVIAENLLAQTDDEPCQEFRGQTVLQIEAVHNLRKVRMYLNVLSLRSTS